MRAFHERDAVCIPVALRACTGPPAPRARPRHAFFLPPMMMNMTHSRETPFKRDFDNEFRVYHNI